jgi:excisionase family DNA binding protein
MGVPAMIGRRLPAKALPSTEVVSNRAESPVVSKGFLIKLPELRPNGRGELTEREAAVYLGCSVRKVQYLRKAGAISAKRIGGTLRYPITVLDKYCDSQAA